jgi:ATP-dependent Clp protease adaptor protein ClpS
VVWCGRIGLFGSAVVLFRSPFERVARFAAAAGRTAIEGNALKGEQQTTDVAVPVSETVRRRRAARAAQPKRQPRYHVVLWDDDDHSYAYVIAMMRKLFGYSLERGLQIAEEVDSKGRVICLTTTKEHAELKRDQIHAFGKDSLIDRCSGSMSASIEPEEC